ncbi:hypothetical protein [Reticulibacter mediterranei]|nr:hypothetical protein [Reticulibacter mediterranei]
MLLSVHGLLQFSLIQLVELYLSNKIGVKTNTFWTGLSTRRPGVVSKETPYGLLAAKVWRRALCWWVVPVWQGAALTGSSGAWAGSTCLGVDPADLVQAVTPDGYKHPAVKLVARVRGELSELARSKVANAVRTARRNRQYGRWAVLRLRLLGKFLLSMLLQPLGRASIRSVRWLLPKRENAELQSLMRLVRVAHVLGVILLFTPVMLFRLAPGAVVRRKNDFMIFSPLVGQVGIKFMIEEESGMNYYLAEYGQWPCGDEAEMEVFGNAGRLMVTSVPDTAANIGPVQWATNWLNRLIGNHNAQVYRVLPGGLNIIFAGPMTAAQAQALGKGSEQETSEPEVESNTL